MATQPVTRKRKSPYAKLPVHARLLVRALEIILPDCRYAPGQKYTSRVMRAATRVLTPGSEEGVRADDSLPNVWYIKSESRPRFNRWYVVDLKELTCDVDTSRIALPPNVHIREDDFFCEDFKKTGMCFHILIAAIAEAVRLDSREFPEEE
jgi:hypothetical protein